MCVAENLLLYGWCIHNYINSVLIHLCRLFSVTILVTFSVVAIGFALLSSLCIIAVSGKYLLYRWDVQITKHSTLGILLLSLLFFFIVISSSVTGFVVSLYVFGRLITSILANDSFRQGIILWYDEMKQYIASELPSTVITFPSRQTLSSPSIVKQEETGDDSHFDETREKVQ